MKWPTWVRPLALLAWLLPGGASAAGVAATDDVGARVSLPAPALRIVSLAPSATEIVYAAGAGAALVGVVSSSDFPPAAGSVTRVGDAHGLDLERIVALAPDLIVTWPYTVPAQLARLRARGIAIFTVDPRDVDGIAGAVAQVGVLAGTRPVADAAARDLRARYAELTAHYRDRPSIAVFYEVWGAPVVTLGGTHIVTRALETCGGRNVFAEAGGPAPNVGVEAVLVAKPEVIIAGVAGAVRPAWLDDWLRWPMLPAVAYGNLLAVNADWVHRPGPRFVDGVAELCRTLDEARRRRGQHRPAQP